MTNFFFERYGPEIFRGLHKWCCERILRRFRLFRAKKIFFKNWKFFYFFCISGVTDFLKNDQLLFWEIPAWNLSWSAQMVLQKNFKAFKVVSSEKKIFPKIGIFFDFFCISGVTDFLKNDQLLFWEIPTGNLSWTAQMVLRTNFKAFNVVSSEKKFFQKLEIFWLFLHIRGHRFLEKWLTTFLRNTGLKFAVDCTNGVANKFLGVLGCFKQKNSFLKIGNFLTFFAYRGAMDFMKHHQWNWSKTPQMVYFENKLRHFSLFPSKIIFYYNLQFLEFFPCL